MDSSGWLDFVGNSQYHIGGIKPYIFATCGHFRLLIPAGRYNGPNGQVLCTHHYVAY